MASIRRCTIAEIEAMPNIHKLLDEYAAESSPSIKGVPSPAAKVDMYKAMENNGTLCVIGAFHEDALIGFIIILKPLLPHYSIVIAVAESFFVAKAHRKTGAGLKLLQTAEDYAKGIGSPGLLVSAPFGGVLAEVLPHVGYVETNRVFFKGFGNE